MKSFFLALSIIVWTTSITSVQAQTADVSSFVRALYIEGIPYEQAVQFDADSAVPVLLNMLADPNEVPYWSNIVFTLGMLGDVRAVDPLIQFLEAGSGATLSHAHFVAKSSVPMALGYLLNKHDSAKALAYLQAGAQPSTWAARGLSWTSPVHTRAPDRDAQLSKMAIIGLAVSGRPAARQTLAKLARDAATAGDRAFQERVRAVVTEAIEAHDQIERDGLIHYDSARRRF